MNFEPEIIMHYNVEDDRFYFYLGKDYLHDTPYIDNALQYMKKTCNIRKLKYDNRNIIVEEMKEFANKVSSSKEESIKFLQEVGILDENGKVAEPYKHVFKDV